MEVKKATNNRRRRAGRKKKILSPNSLRVLQDLADQDWKVIESSTKRAISKLNDVGTVAQFLVGGGEEKVAEKLDETSATARTNPLRHAADSNSQDKSEQNAQKVTRWLPRVRNRTRRPALRSKVPLFDDSGKLNEIVSATTRTDALMTALPHVADSNSQDKSGHNAQKMTLDLIQRKGTQLPTLGMGASFLLGSYVEKDEDKPKESYSNEGLRKHCQENIDGYQESKCNSPRENSQKPSPRLSNESAFRTSKYKSSSGRFAYWRDNVRRMNYSQMWSSHLHRQQQETAQMKMNTRQRSVKSFSIMNTSKTTIWDPRKARLGHADIVREEAEVRVITCFGCGEPGHKLADCPRRAIK